MAGKKETECEGRLDGTGAARVRDGGSAAGERTHAAVHRADASLEKACTPSAAARKVLVTTARACYVCIIREYRWISNWSPISER